MTLKEFYEQIDSDYKDVIKRLCSLKIHLLMI